MLPVAILAGGLATRLRPVTETIPKALVEVAGRPFAEYQAELLAGQGLREVVWLVGYRGDQIEAGLGDGGRWGMRFRYVYDGPVLLGTGGAIGRALDLLGPEFFVMYGDSYLECDFAAVVESYRTSGKTALMTVYRNDGEFDRSNVEFRDGAIRRYDKRSSDPALRHIDWGLGLFAARAWAPYAPGLPLDLERVYQDLLRNHDLAAFEVSRRFYEIGSPDGLAELESYLRTKAERR